LRAVAVSCDPKRVAITGWSHDGLIALMASFDHPEKFACVYAGVPVSDLLTRFGYTEQSYLQDFPAAYHVGKPPVDAVKEYRRRSPIWHVQKLKVPLMVTTTTTNDRDVNVVEAEQRITHLNAPMPGNAQTAPGRGHPAPSPRHYGASSAAPWLPHRSSSPSACRRRTRLLQYGGPWPGERRGTSVVDELDAGGAGCSLAPQRRG
jgi:hypothetical protein